MSEEEVKEGVQAEPTPEPTTVADENSEQLEPTV